GRTPHRARSPAPHVGIWGLVCEGRLHDEGVEVDVLVLLARVGDGAVEQLGHQRSRRLAGETQHVHRVGDVLAANEGHDHPRLPGRDPLKSRFCYGFHVVFPYVTGRKRGADLARTVPTLKWRSEEHTSELQSRENLVCRLLLEKKKQLTY